jgi:hypothetical protein
MTQVRNRGPSVIVFTVVCLAQPVYGTTSCTLKFSLAGWSAIYETASGSGTITCDDGQSARVSIQTKGGGLTFGKSKIADGRGTFSPVGKISELYGNYAKAEVQAGVGPSSNAQIVTKGPVSLALAGTGTGIGVGFDFGRFTIQPGAAKK